MQEIAYEYGILEGMEAFIFEYYLSLLQVQMAILGIVVAGLVTLMQMLSNAVPKRKVTMLAGSVELFSFFCFLSLLLFTLAVATWATAFADKTSLLMEVFSDRLVGIILLLLCLGGLLWFVHLIYRTKRLLDPHKYLKHYNSNTSPHAVREYIGAVYGHADHATKTGIRKGFRQTHEIKKELESIDKLYDPFQPIREYIKHNAQQQYDYGTAAGLRLFGQLFDKTFENMSEHDAKEHRYLAQYLADSSEEFFRVFHKVASEKRKLDVIRLVYARGQKFLEIHDDKSLLIIIRALEEMGRLSHDEDEIVTVIECTQDLTNTYLSLHQNAPWHEISGNFEEICLSVSRLAESYYLSDKPLRSVPLISYYTGKTRNVSVAFVDFFVGYKNLADLRIEAYPKLYFEAVEALCEALYARMRAINDSGKAAIGLNSNYHMLTVRLYSIYHSFALEAISHRRPDLFGLSLSNLRRIIKSAHRFDLPVEREAITKMMIELGAASIHSLGDVEIKGHRKIGVYVAETLSKHADKDDVVKILDELAGKNGIDHLRQILL